MSGYTTSLPTTRRAAGDEAAGATAPAAGQGDVRPRSPGARATAEVAVFLVLGTAVMLPFRALLAWVYNRTGSLLLVGLLHAASNGAAVGAGFGPGLLPRLYPGQGTESLHVLATAILGVAVFALTRARLGAGRP